MANKKPFNFGDAPLVQDTERTVESGYEAIEQKEQGGGIQHKEQQLETDREITASTTQHLQTKKQEQTKGVQTYIPMSQYLRINNMRAVRGETIANLVSQAIAFWLDVQEGKQIVKSPEL